MTHDQREYVKALVKAEVALAYQKLYAEIAVLRAEHAVLRAKIEMITGVPLPPRPTTSPPRLH
jgi:hypothetical protein